MSDIQAAVANTLLVSKGLHEALLENEQLKAELETVKKQLTLFKSPHEHRRRVINDLVECALGYVPDPGADHVAMFNRLVELIEQDEDCDEWKKEEPHKVKVTYLVTVEAFVNARTPDEVSDVVETQTPEVKLTDVWPLEDYTVTSVQMKDCHVYPT